MGTSWSNETALVFQHSLLLNLLLRLNSNHLFTFQTAVPKNETSYMCVAFEIPKLNEAHHIVQVQFSTLAILTSLNVAHNDAVLSNTIR